MSMNQVTPPIVGILTVSEEEILAGEVWKLLDSIPHDVMKCIVVFRSPNAPAQELVGHPSVMKVVATEPCGVSHARNIGLRALLMLNPADNLIVCFPDDDGSYPRGMLQKVVRRHETNDLVLGTYGSSKSRAALDRIVLPLTEKVAFRNASSAGIYVQWRVIRMVGGFNEGLGVGSTHLQAGEDLDFVVRAIKHSGDAIFDPEIYFSHPIRMGADSRRVGAYISIASANTPRIWALTVLARSFFSAVLHRNSLTLAIWSERMTRPPKLTGMELG